MITKRSHNLTGKNPSPKSIFGFEMGKYHLYFEIFGGDYHEKHFPRINRN